MQAGASVAGAAASTATAAVAGGGAAMAGRSSGTDAGNGSGGLGYFTDALFRRDPSAAPTAGGDANANAGATSGEVSRIFVEALRNGSLSADDTRYVGQLVAQRTGLSQQDAEKRVTDTFGRAKAAADDAANKAREAADKARKAVAYSSLWIFVALLVGAFTASLMATYGGRRRDL